MNILVTGASGFIGSRLCRALAVTGEHRVYALVREASRDTFRDSAVESVLYNSSIADLTAALAERRIEGIVHLASLFLAQHTPEDVDRLVEANLLFGTHLLEAAVGSGVNWFINTSSFWQHYGNHGYSPVALYAATKEAFEVILQYYRETSRIRIVSLELFDTYGPGDPRPKLFSFLKNLLGKQDVLAMSPGEQLMNLLYIDDVIEAYIIMVGLLREQVPLEDKYCISAAELFSLRRVVALFSEIAGSELNIEWGGRPYRDREFMDPLPVYPLVPGWKPRHSLAEGLAILCRQYGDE